MEIDTVDSPMSTRSGGSSRKRSTRVSSPRKRSQSFKPAKGKARPSPSAPEPPLPEQDAFDATLARLIDENTVDYVSEFAKIANSAQYSSEFPSLSESVSSDMEENAISVSAISPECSPATEEPSLPLPSPSSGDAPPTAPQLAAPPSGPVAPPTEAATDLAGAPKPAARKRQRRARFLRINYTDISVPTPDIGKVTILFRPTDPAKNLGALHQGKIFKQLSEAGSVALVRDIRGGAIAVDLPLNADPAPFLNISSLLDTPVKASLPASQVCRSAVIHGLHPEVEEQEFLDEVSSDFKVIGFTRLARPGQSSWVAKLLFQGTTTPKTVRYAGRSYRVSAYNPKPRQCENCHQYNHRKEHCKHALRCPACGGSHSLPCTAGAPKCLNCGGAHSATDPLCPARGFHSKVAQVRATANLSAPAAKAAVHRAAKTYAAAAAKKPAHSCRPEPSANNIFNNKPSDQTACFVADVLAAVLTAVKTNNFVSLLTTLETILAAFTGAAVPEGALKDLLRTRTMHLHELSA